MGSRFVLILFLLVLLLPLSSLAVTRYVWTNSPSPAAPYTAWNSAAHTIQEAIDVSDPDDVVLVTNGIYRTGGRPASGHVLTNRVLLNRAIDVRSVSGPTRTIIEGAGPLGLDAVRCLFITNSAGMSGFTLRQGHTINDGAPGTALDKSGGGAILFSGGMLSNCIVSHCEAADFGGGCYITGHAYLVNCEIMTNEAVEGGGVYCRNEGTLINCRIRENQSANGGGICIESNGVLNLLAVAGEYCRVYDNVASNFGGGIFVRHGGLNVSGRVVIAENEATDGGGIAAINESVIQFDAEGDYTPSVYYNTAYNSGGAFFAQDTGTVMNLRNTLIGYLDPEKGPKPNWAQGALGGGGGILLLNGASMTGCNLRIEYNEASQAAGGGILVSHAQLHLRAEYNPLLCATTAVSYMRHNEATNNHGGAIHAQDDAVIRIEQVVLADNAALRGGGAYIASGSTAEFYNVVFSSNLATTASGALRVYGSGSRADLRHVTAAGNTTGGIETAINGWVCLTNCIIASHPGVNLTAGNEAGYSDIEGGYPGTGNVNYDPNLDSYNSLQLRPTLYSVGDVVDMGTPAGVTNDLLGRPRPQNAIYDMGAYEYTSSRDDYDGDGMADGWESDHSLNPTDPADGPVDSDGDSIPNDDEFMADTDPHDIDAFFQLDDIYRSELHPERGVTACFTSSADRCYSLYASDQPADNQWAPVAGQVLAHGTGGPDGLYDTNSQPRRLYRVEVSLPAP